MKMRNAESRFILNEEILEAGPGRNNQEVPEQIPEGFIKILCAQRDSNPHQQNRNLQFYPLNYGHLY